LPSGPYPNRWRGGIRGIDGSATVKHSRAADLSITVAVLLVDGEFVWATAGRMG